ncbi:MAG: RNA polymerase sigma factor [Acidimicrobiales bacterium]
MNDAGVDEAVNGEVDAPERGERLRSGDSAVWEELYTTMYPAMASYARRRLPAEEARDAVSETMARALARPERLPVPPATPEGWLFGILRHVVLDAQRRSYRGMRAVRRSPAVGTDWLAADEGLYRAEEEKAVRAAFALLSPRDQEILELRVLGGLSVEETGRVLGVRAGAVRNAQHRALRRLHAHLDGEGSSP